MSGTNIYDGMWDGTYGGGICLSSDSGRSWLAVGDTLLGGNTNTLAVNGTNLFASTNGNSEGVFYSKDTGKSWTIANNGLSTFFCPDVLLPLGSKIFAGISCDGIFVSTDSGKSWSASDSGLLYYPSCMKLAASGMNLLTGTNGAGLFLSTDEGGGWENPGFTCGEGVDFSFLSAFGANVYASSSRPDSYSDEYSYSTDNGISWGGPVHGGINFTAIAKIGPDLFFGTDSGGVMLSTDSGANWTSVNNGLEHNDTFISYDFKTNQWNTRIINVSLTISSLMSNGTNLFTGTEAGLYLSTNNGSNWLLLDSSLNDIHSFATIGSELFVGTSHGVLSSTDNGINWSSMNNGLTDTVINVFAVSGSNLFAGTSDSGVYLSPDSGKSWKLVNTGLDALHVNDLLANESNLYEGTGAGVWRRPLSDFGISSVAQTPVAAQPEIQSFPNPFTQSTEITFATPAAGYPEVSIVNALGAEVARLYAGELEAGNHSFAWDASTVTAGNYWCVVRMNGLMETLPLAFVR